MAPFPLSQGAIPHWQCGSSDNKNQEHRKYKHCVSNTIHGPVKNVNSVHLNGKHTPIPTIVTYSVALLCHLATHEESVIFSMFWNLAMTADASAPLTVIWIKCFSPYASFGRESDWTQGGS